MVNIIFHEIPDDISFSSDSSPSHSRQISLLDQESRTTEQLEIEGAANKSLATRSSQGTWDPKPTQRLEIMFNGDFDVFASRKSTTKNLRTKIDQLTATRDLVRRMIDAALNNNQVIRESAQTWLCRAEIVLEEARLIDEAGLVNNWFKGWYARFSLGKKAEHLNFIIQALLDERNDFGDIVSNPKPIQSIEIVFDGDFVSFALRESTTKKIVEALKDGEIKLIGVFGMPGVGKTKLLEAVSKSVKKDRLFDEVVLVTVSQNPNFEYIQDSIAKQLDLWFDNEDTFVTKKVKLNDRINQGKKTLVVLDDMWERMEIAEVGIPPKSINNDYKVVFTTRLQGVCQKMESDVSIEVTLLTAEESWQLFRKSVGDAPHNSIMPVVAKDIVNECKGLPLAIVQLGKTLRGKNETFWNSTLQKLRMPYFAGRSLVFSAIEMSYNFLGSEETKKCFLLCSQYPEDYKIDIDNFFYNVMSKKLLRNADTVMEARSMFHLIVDELVSSCLLQRDEEGYIIMHDIVRDVAISIASMENNSFIGNVSSEENALDLNQIGRRYDASLSRLAKQKGQSCLADGPDVAAIVGRLSALETQNGELLARSLDAEQKLDQSKIDHQVFVDGLEAQIAQIKEDLTAKRVDALKALDKKMTKQYEDPSIKMGNNVNSLLLAQKNKYLGQLKILEDYIQKITPATPRNH